MEFKYKVGSKVVIINDVSSGDNLVIFKGNKGTVIQKRKAVGVYENTYLIEFQEGELSFGIWVQEGSLNGG